MLAVTAYPLKYVNDVKKRIRADVKAFRTATSSLLLDDTTREHLSVVFYNNLLIVVDAHFVHRLRTNELKDGNPLNEVRVLVRSLLENDGRMVRDTSIKLHPEHSLMGYRVGDKIALSEKDFTRVANAFFREIEAKFT